ncbi:MAG: hypothetical protein SF002_12905 [Alphaproteobacteria bacterium]|nr:hypothetical protein [Alphaproteobacteria bacterium]
MTVFDDAPVAAFADIWRELVAADGAAAAAMQAWDAMDRTTVQRDPDRTMALTALALDHLPENYRHACLLEMAWNSVHGSRPDYALHRRCVDQWWIGSGRASVADVKPVPKPRRPRRDRRLRIGFLAQMMLRNPHYFNTAIVPTLAALPKDQFAVFLYAEGSHPLPETLVSLVEHAKPLGNLNSAAWDIAADDLDVFFYLNGFGAYSPFQLLRARPATRIASMMHCYTTFGPELIDAVVQDRDLVTPVHAQTLHEVVVESDGPVLMLGVSADAPPVVTAPRHRVGHIVFGAFNRANKITAELALAWAQILDSVPKSTLLLANFTYQHVNHRKSVLSLLSDAGVDLERVAIAPFTSETAEYLGLYSTVDIALDTAPFNGGITTLDAISQGVPVVTLCSEDPNGCMGRYFLSHVGRHDLVTNDHASYVQRAIALADEGGALDHWRDTARDRLLASRLIRPGDFSDRFADVVRTVLATPSAPDRAVARGG